MLLTPEQHRILHNRIAAALEIARYHPASMMDVGEIADHVLRSPFTQEEHNSGKDKG